MRRLLALFLALPLALPAAGTPLATGDNAVAWIAAKRFMFKKMNPVGVNKAATAELKSLGKDSFQVRVEIPLDKFDSGDANRDADVFKTLGGEVQPNLTFESEPQSGKAFAALRNGSGIMKGQLSLAGKAYPVSFEVTGNGQSVAGHTTVSLKALEVKAPSAVGGLMMKVSDAMELYFQFDLANVKGQAKAK